MTINTNMFMKAFLHKTKKCISVSVITSQPSAAQLLKIIVVWFFSSIFLLKQKPLSSCSFCLLLWVPSLFSFWNPLTSYSNLIHICIGTFLQSFMKLLVAFLLFMRFFVGLFVCFAYSVSPSSFNSMFYSILFFPGALFLLKYELVSPTQLTFVVTLAVS